MLMKNILFVAICCSILFYGCSDIDSDTPDVSHIQLDYKLVRFDEELFAIDTLDVQSGFENLKNKYPAFIDLYFSQILPLADPNSEQFLKELRLFLTEKSIIYLKDTTSVVFGDFVKEKQEFDKAFKFLKYYFPKLETPNVYTIISEFGYQRFLFSDENKDGLGIGLDLFLGSEYPYKAIAPENPAFSNYLTRSFNKDHLVRNAMEIIVDDLVGEAPGSRMLDQMINNGKKLYLLHKLMPALQDSVLYVYPQEKLDWVRDNELEMWSFFFDENLFYETNMIKINKYINPSPNSPGMPDIAPGRTANYIGFQIVKAYMKRNPDFDFQDLISEKDHQKIMDQSRYKPRQKKS